MALLDKPSQVRRQVESGRALPLLAGQKVTGHKRTDMVLKHCFQPGGEDFRQTLHSAMPKLPPMGTRHQRRSCGRCSLDTVKPKALRERLLKVWAKL